MTGSTTDARKRAASIIDGPDERIGQPPPTVPRLARTVDDLAVGQWLATRHHASGTWETTVVPEAWIDVPWDFSNGRVVILADALPAPGWVVPADTMAALREALADDPDYTPTRIAARAVLDAAREVER